VWGLIITGLGSPIIAPFVVAVALYAVGFNGDHVGFVAQIVANWTCVALLVLLVTKAEALPLASMGFGRPRWRDVPLGMAGYVVALIATAVVASNLIEVDEGPIEELFALPMWIRAAMFVTAPTTEEILFRGYALERLAFLTKRMWLAAVITSAFFVLLHAPFYGLRESLVRIPVTLVLTALYIRTRTLWAPIVTHLLFDIALLFA
jgi:uncharacterized protein